MLTVSDSLSGGGPFACGDDCTLRPRPLRTNSGTAMVTTIHSAVTMLSTAVIPA